MDDEFNDYLEKFNKEMDDKNINPNADRTFLDRKERPTDSMIIDLFITEDDMLNGVDLTNYTLSELGNPDKIKTIEGTEWILSKLVWYVKEGRVITFDIIKLSATMDEISEAKDELINPIRLVDITFKDVSDKPDTYKSKLDDALEEEDYIEAARLRDWFKKLNELIAQAFNLSNNNFPDKLEEKLDEINKFREKL